MLQRGKISAGRRDPSDTQDTRSRAGAELSQGYGTSSESGEHESRFRCHFTSPTTLASQSVSLHFLAFSYRETSTLPASWGCHGNHIIK